MRDSVELTLVRLLGIFKERVCKTPIALVLCEAYPARLQSWTCLCYQYLTRGLCVSSCQVRSSQLHALGEPSGRINQAMAPPRSYRLGLPASASYLSELTHIIMLGNAYMVTSKSRAFRYIIPCVWCSQLTLPRSASQSMACSEILRRHQQSYLKQAHDSHKRSNKVPQCQWEREARSLGDDHGPPSR